MAKSLRAKSKQVARSLKRTDPNSDYVKAEQERMAKIAANLAERQKQPMTGELHSQGEGVAEGDTAMTTDASMPDDGEQGMFFPSCLWLCSN